MIDSSFVPVQLWGLDGQKKHGDNTAVLFALEVGQSASAQEAGAILASAKRRLLSDNGGQSVAARRHEDALSKDTIEGFNSKVANPAFFCGGGSVAALTGSNAAALTLLVMQLNARRKRNRDHAREIAGQIRIVESIRDQLYAAADHDLVILDALLHAQREMKQAGNRCEYQTALLSAARSPYQICELCLALLRIIETQLPIASRFTVSDLGAAAALLVGAIEGAILTTDVNVALLRDEPDVDHYQLGRLETDAITLVEATNAAGDRIRSRTLAAIRKRPDRQGE